MLIQEFLQNSAEQYPDKTALIVKDIRYSYSELDALSNSLAQLLIGQGLQPGERVVLCLRNTIEAVVAIFGILKASGVFVFLNPSIKIKKLSYIISNCEAAAFIGTSRYLGIVQQNPDDFRSVRIQLSQETFDATIGAYKNDIPECHAGEQDTACLIYTSGSTGEPKGVISWHENVDFVSNAIITYLENIPEDIVINVLPFSFDYGLYQLLMTVRFGGTLVLEPSFVYPGELCKRIQSERVTGLPVVPTMVALMMKTGWPNEELKTLRYITNTAAALPVEQIKIIRKELPSVKIYSMYGLTECKRTLYLPPELLDQRPNSVGIAIPGTQAWLEDEQGNRLNPGSTGELVIQGPHVMQGYWKDPETTSRTFKEGSKKKGRVLYSGDLFRTDFQGYFYFVARKDDIIKSRGEKVSPREVEEAAHSIDGVIEAAAVGVPDPILGQKIKLFVVSTNPSLTENQVKRHCQKRLEDYMVPHVVEFRDSLPKTESGKIRKNTLHEV